MNKISTLLIIGVIALALGIGAYMLMPKKDTAVPPMMKKDADTMMKRDEGTMMKKDEESMMEKEDDGMMKNKNDRYVEYTSAAFVNAKDTRRILFFYASWCPTCKPADESFTQNQDKIPQDVTVMRVNYNDPDTDEEEKNLARKYAVTYQHTFVQIDSNGSEIAKWNGGKIEELITNIK